MYFIPCIVSILEPSVDPKTIIYSKEDSNPGIIVCLYNTMNLYTSRFVKTKKPILFIVFHYC